MARLGTFVPRLLTLTLVWLLATAALTYAAAQRLAAGPTTPPTTAAATTAATPQTVVVPDVRHQAYVFAEGTLGDAGFAWKVVGPVQGYAANTVVSESPAPGTALIDTGAPTITLRLAHDPATQQLGEPEQTSPVAGTAVRLAALALAAAPPRAVAPKTSRHMSTHTHPAARRPSTHTRRSSAHVAARVAARRAAAATVPAHRWPQHRPPAFVVPGARREPLDEMPLTNRAQMLLRWIERRPKPTDANVRYWLYQHAWVVAGADMGWWRGADALRTLIEVDRRVWSLWGIGSRSEQVARTALAVVEAKSR